MARRNSNLPGPKTPAAGESRRPVLSHLRAILDSLNPTERTIADSVLSDPEKVIVSSIAEMKDGCGASVGSIVAFCRRLGLKGFAEFKIALARELAQSGLPAGQAKPNGSVLEKVLHFHAQSLTETLQLNSQTTFERVAQALEKASRIEFFSIGLSYPVAYTASSKLMLIGFPAATQFDSHMQLIAATQLRSDSVAFGISCSGTTRETMQCMEVAKAKGATTVCLTNAMNSPIAANSELSLYAAPSQINHFQAPLASRITQLAVIDALFVHLALKSKNKTAGRLQQSSEALLRRRLA